MSQDSNEQKTEEQQAQDIINDVEAELVDDAEEAEDAEETVESLQQKVDQMQVKLDQATKIAQEATARAQAEVQNLRKRLERDTDNARKFALERFTKELITVVDSLDRGIENLPEDTAQAVREGMELTYKQFVDVLKKHQVEVVNPKGETFNPDLHEAVAMVPSDQESNTVIDVMQKGYTLNGRLLRSAMVAVAQ